MPRATVGCVAIVLLLCGCVTGPASDEARLTQRHWRNAADWSTSMAREEADFLRRPEARASRDAGGLHLLLNDGRVVTVTEDRACSGRKAPHDVLRDCVRKHAIARFAEHGYWLLAVTLQEGEAYALVSARDGHETMLIGPPYFSPDGRYLAAVSKGLYGDTVNGIEVWRLDGAGPELVFFHEEKGDAGYDFADWFSADTARLTYRGCVGRPDLACERPREAVLTGRGGKWRLVPWTR